MGKATTLKDVARPTNPNATALVELQNSTSKDHPQAFEIKTSISYATLESSIATISNLLVSQCHIQRGDVISLVARNCTEFLIAYLGIVSVGASIAPLNPDYTVDEYEFYIGDLKAKAIVSIYGQEIPAIQAAASKLNIPIWYVKNNGSKKDELVLSLEGVDQVHLKQHHVALPTPDPEDIAMFLHTSGTTSRPKLVPLSHKNILKSLHNISNTYELSDTDVTLLVMPLFHVHGLIAALLSTIISGGKVVLPPNGKFSASTFWPIVKEYKVTWYTAVPTIHQVLLMRAKSDFLPLKQSDPAAVHLRFIRSCSSALAPSVLTRLEEVFEAPVLEAYGMTEAAHQMASNPLPKYGSRKIGTVGKAQGLKIAILDEQCQVLPAETVGEVCLQGENVTKGYFNNETANQTAFAGGWFHTGDQGKLDSEGYLTLTGRIKELINRGGEKISPLEIDDALLGHPQVSEAISFGGPDEKYGEVVYAAVVLSPEARAADTHVTEKELITFLSERLSKFKVPSKIFFAESLPKNATGKIQRRFVAAHFLEAKKE
eukprot:CAMPEP_0184692716 /NCGR_PEP_ID=MMETSP0313-20130426/1074_1 /TAXON_ID=2792 /ORGANISM="Porphyridium aerugineum, Strain SAG 1380-2" /LENGTH=543 /DNA_ID=CAMNT_0027150565 /DNA_START=43 /DNA_END=1674 /DNA_ORIENTATION=+